MDVNGAPIHTLLARRPLPGSVREGGVHALRWSGTAVMGVLNLTPDSFSDGGRYPDVAAALRAADAMIRAGARFVDVGGESTRPGARPVPPEEERRRILPVVEALVAEGRAVVSVDSRHAEVARDALAAGAHLVNDVTGLRDPALRAACAEAGAPAIAMHMQGEPGTMQDDPHYEDVVAEVEGFLARQAERAEAEGVPSVMVDPGIGFGKTSAHNLALLRAVPRLAAAGRPLMIGASRKRLVGQLTGENDADQRDAGSVAIHLDAARRGAAVVRVHDVRSHVQALAVQVGLTAAAGPGEDDDRIVMEGMEFHGYHGAFPEERRFGARFVVDVEMRCALPDDDVLARTVDYARMYTLVEREVTRRRYRLIEALAARIAERVLISDPRVREATVRVHKPHAPLPGVVRDVRVEVVRRR